MVAYDPNSIKSKLKKHLDSMNQEFVASLMIGQDPSMYAVHHILVTRMKGIKGEDCYAVMTAIDWTLHPDPDNAKWGVTTAHGDYRLTYDDAMSAAYSKRSDQRSRYRWQEPVVPNRSSNTRPKTPPSRKPSTTSKGRSTPRRK